MAGLLNKEGRQQATRGRMGASMSRDTSRPNEERLRLGRDAATDLTEGTRAMNATDEEEPNVSPEEQEQYTRFVENGSDLIYDEKGLDKLVQAIDGDGNPVEGMANTLATVVMRLQDSAEKAGEKLDGEMMMQGAAELFGLLVEVAEKANVHKFSEKDQESAWLMANDIFRSTRQQQGRLPVDQLQADFEQMMQAEQAGTLDEMLPGIQEYAQRAQQGQ